jgi:hypothetical protein
MSDWDAVFGEAALGLDLAKVDPARAGSGNAPALRIRPSAGSAQPRDLAAESATPVSAAPGSATPVSAVPGSATPVSAAPGSATPVSAAPVSAATAASTESRSARAARPSLKLASRPTAPTAPTANREAIFRREALEFRVRGRRTPGGLVRLGARWIHWTYRMLFVLVLLAVAAVWIIHTDESASGPAIVDGRTGTVALLLPAAVGPDLASSRGFTVALPGGGSVGIIDLHAQLADNTAIRKAGLAPSAQPAILVTGQLTPGVGAASVLLDAHVRTQAFVVLRSESLADLLGRQFRAMVSNGNAP